MKTFLIVFIFVGANIAFLMSIRQFLKPRSFQKFLLGVFYAIIAIWQIGNGLFQLDLLKSLPVFVIIFISSTYCFAPSIYLYFSVLLNSHQKSYRTGFHFLPAILAFIFISLYYLLNRDHFIQDLTTSLNYYTKGFLWLALYAGVILNFIYLLFLFYKHKNIFFNKLHKSEEEKKTIKILLLGFMTCTIFYLVSLSVLSFSRYMIGTTFTSVFIFYMFMVSHSKAIFFEKFINLEVKLKYPKRSLTEQGIQTHLDHLKKLLQVDKVFIDENLSAKKMAAMLDLSTRELSELLNLYLKTNFGNLINLYRVDYSCELIKNFPEKPLQRICLEAGFNSYTTFFDHFKRIKHESPIDYKDTIHKHFV